MRSNRSDDRLPPELEQAFVAARARMAPLGRRTLYFASTASTNDVAAELAAAGAQEGTIVLADAQTSGRGRRGRSWFSPPGSGLYVSVILAPARSAVNPERAPALLTLTAGVALAEGVEAATGLLPAIKWPNDLVVGRRKLAGILAEAVAPDAIVLGYGINVLPAAYPPDLADRATSLESELGRAIDRSVVLVETLAALARRYRDLLGARFDAILDEWRRRAPDHRGARVSWETAAGVRRGVTCGLDEHGALLVRVGDRVERIVGGELTWSFHAASD